jgi:hypothetical protein
LPTFYEYPDHRFENIGRSSEQIEITFLRESCLQITGNLSENIPKIDLFQNFEAANTASFSHQKGVGEVAPGHLFSQLSPKLEKK